MEEKSTKEMKDAAESAAEIGTEQEASDCAEESEVSGEGADTSEKDGLNADDVSEEEINKLARHYRHIGFAIFGGLALLLVIFLTYTVISGYNKGEVFDPSTGEKVVSE